jgi:antitoxin HigA-1
MNKLRPQPGQSLLAAGVQPVVPGDYLARQFLEPRRLNTEQAAQAIGIDVAVLKNVLGGGRISPNTADRLAQYTGTTTQLWLNMQEAADKATPAAGIT